MKFCHAACSARLASGGVRCICGLGQRQPLRGSRIALRDSHLPSRCSGRSCLRITAAAACSACLRACGLLPAGNRDVRVRAYALLSASTPGRAESFAHAAPPARQLCREQKSETAQCCLPA